MTISLRPFFKKKMNKQSKYTCINIEFTNSGIFGSNMINHDGRHNNSDNINDKRRY